MNRKILFVCLGNICRSPIAEGIFAHLCKERNLDGRYQADSAGTGDWHVGERPDPRSIAVAHKHGVQLPSIGRQVKPMDFREYDMLVAMDHSNQRDLISQCPSSLRSKIHLMRDYGLVNDKGLDVPEPYYGGADGFDEVYAILRRSCIGLLDTLESETRPSDVAKA